MSARWIAKVDAMELLGWDAATWEAARAGRFIPEPEIRNGAEVFDWNIIETRMGRALKAPRSDATGSIYFIKSGKFIKIGYTTDLVGRIRSLQTGSPNAIELLHSMPGARADEQALHAKFKKERAEGEWFKSSPRLRVHIIRLKAAAEAQ